jgi:hypothetical protein
VRKRAPIGEHNGKDQGMLRNTLAGSKTVVSISRGTTLYVGVIKLVPHNESYFRAVSVLIAIKTETARTLPLLVSGGV